MITQRDPVEGTPASGGGTERPTFLRRSAAVIAAIAGPVAIVVSVLAVYHDMVFGGFVTNQHGDILSLVLPQYCFLGKSLAAGHVPAWNPSMLSGVRFAGDPQSGWMYLPAMFLFSLLSCGAAIRWYIVLQPILAGLGVYALLRSERLERPAASLGGIALALVMADSFIGLSLAASSSIAWTALMLAATSRFLRAETWPGRIGWGVATAAAWGQLAGAYMSTGLAVGTAGLLVFLVVRSVADVRSRRRSPLQAVGRAAFLGAILVPVNLAVFAPRLAYSPHTTLGLGYNRLASLGAHLQGVSLTEAHRGSQAGWPLGLANSPGSYLGATTLVLALAALWSRRHRALAVAFSVYGLLLYVFSLQATGNWVSSHLHGLPLVEFYLHDPGRLRYGFVLPMAVLGGIGLSAWLEAASWRQRALVLVPGVVVFAVLPGAIGVPNAYSTLFVAGGVAAVVVLACVGAIRRAAVLVPVLVLAELLAGGFAGQATAFEDNGLGRFASPDGTFFPYQRPTIDAGAYTRHDAIAAYLAGRQGRYLADDPRLGNRTGYLKWQRPEFWGLEQNGRSMLFGLADVGGYNSVEPLRYWELIRRLQRAPLVYNVTTLLEPTGRTMDLLGVRWVIASAGAAPLSGLLPVVREGQWELYRRTHAAPPAELFTTWRAVPNMSAALGAVAAPSFDPARSLVVEGGRPPAVAQGGGPAAVRYESAGPQESRVSVKGPAAGLLLVRNQWDENWKAAVDGRPAPVLPADGAFQAVPVPAGRHVVVLTYDDPTVGWGLIGSAVVLALLGLAALLLRRRAAGTAEGTRAPA